MVHKELPQSWFSKKLIGQDLFCTFGPNTKEEGLFAARVWDRKTDSLIRGVKQVPVGSNYSKVEDQIVLYDRHIRAVFSRETAQLREVHVCAPEHSGIVAWIINMTTFDATPFSIVFDPDGEDELRYHLAVGAQGIAARGLGDERMWMKSVTGEQAAIRLGEAQGESVIEAVVGKEEQKTFQIRYGRKVEHWIHEIDELLLQGEPNTDLAVDLADALMITQTYLW